MFSDCALDLFLWCPSLPNSTQASQLPSCSGSLKLIETRSAILIRSSRTGPDHPVNGALQLLSNANSYPVANLLSACQRSGAEALGPLRVC